MKNRIIVPLLCIVFITASLSFYACDKNNAESIVDEFEETNRETMIENGETKIEENKSEEIDDEITEKKEEETKENEEEKKEEEKEEVENKEIVLLDFNIRCKNDDDTGNRSWDVRKNIIYKQIRDYSPDIIGMQEVTRSQFLELKNEFFDEYNFVGSGRDLTLNSEYNPILYNPSRFNLISSGTFWLSTTPNSISKSWDSSCYRICTYVKLVDLCTGKEISYYNTHLDHKSDLAALNGANLIIEKILQDKNPALLTGDMNSDMTSDVYKSFTDSLDDTRYLSLQSNALCRTFNNYKYLTGGSPIDFCFAKKDAFEILSFEVKNTLFDKEGNPLPDAEKASENVCFSSDHFPILVKFKIK